MTAYIFPGQGAQFSGMGKNLYDNSPIARQLFEQANEILNFDLSGIMFEGSDDDLKQTKVTQPAIFVHSVVLAKTMPDFQPDMVAGHSLGEFSALVANNTLTFEDGLRLVSKRARAMQRACELQASTMAAIIGLDDATVEAVCAALDAVVVPANYNCPGQLVISGSVEGIEKACALLQERGAKRALKLAVGGAFHSPLMEPAREELADAIMSTPFNTPSCPVYQNVNAQPVTSPAEIRENLVAQLTAPVRWTQSVENMIANGATAFIELGPGKVLQNLVRKINNTVETAGFE
ncbi:MAG: ACP S-malonyltransferase [Bacteroidales bacterium]|jgi:[acyl-carrier-protein] S-malonyltransferase|nr:ACP S-malonyltransferase [Bacteroidales bacterium]